MVTSVVMWIPPAGSSEGSWNLLMNTPGRLLKALRVMSFVKVKSVNVMPRATTCKDCVERVHVNDGLCRMYVVKSVKLPRMYVLVNLDTEELNLP